MALKIGICGVGAFAPCFIPLIKHHTQVDKKSSSAIWWRRR